MSLINPTDAEKLTQRIVLAFARHPRPNRRELTDAGDNSRNARGLKADFGGRHWQQVSRDVLMDWQDDLSCLTAKAWVYYLQAYLIASLYEEDWELAMATIKYLTPRADDSSLSWFNERLARLDQTQREVLRDFVHLVWLAYYDESDDPDDPRTFWSDVVAIPGAIATKPA